MLMCVYVCACLCKRLCEVNGIKLRIVTTIPQLSLQMKIPIYFMLIIKPFIVSTLKDQITDCSIMKQIEVFQEWILTTGTCTSV